MRAAWDDEHPETPFSEQSVVLTVPASFDAVARELTERAAHEAGFRNLVLLEEPQAAFYAWLDRYPDWREHVGEGDLVLVIDVGGGTTDFTLVAIGAEQGELRLNRVAVGDHLLLGGDNMDLALAHSVAAQLASSGRRLDQMQMHGLWQQCRSAKERLLSNPDSREETVSILGRGSSLIGGSPARQADPGCCGAPAYRRLLPGNVRRRDAAAPQGWRSDGRWGCRTSPTPPSHAIWRASCGRKLRATSRPACPVESGADLRG